MESLLNTPIFWINKYLQEKLAGDLFTSSSAIPFFPGFTPADIDELSSSFVQNENGLFAVYDRMFKMRRSAFPHIRYEQVLYYFYATTNSPELPMLKLQEDMLRLLDRGDESAEDINKWAYNKSFDITDTDGTVVTIKNKFYFHNFKIFHLEETRDIIDFGTARTFAGNKIIIDYCYHQMTPTYQKENDGSYTNIKDINNADIPGTRVVLEDGPLDDGFENPPV